MDPVMDALAGFPVTVEIPVAWAEMDVFGHVNNTVFLRWFESARIEYLHRTGLADAGPAVAVGPILHSTHCRFRRTVVFPDRVVVRPSSTPAEGSCGRPGGIVTSAEGNYI